MPDSYLSPDTLRRPQAEALLHLSAIYRVWQGMILDVADGAQVTLAIDLREDLSVLEMAEYVARAELESTISEVIHGRPTGMGPFQFASIRSRFGNLAAGAVATEIMRRWDAISGKGKGPRILAHQEGDNMSNPNDVVAEGDEVEIAIQRGQLQPTLEPIEPGPDGKVTLGTTGEKEPTEPKNKPDSIVPPSIVSGDTHAPVPHNAPAAAPDGDSHSRNLTSETVP